jgi:hypothetical protein
MKAYRVIAHAIAVCVVLQAAWIAAGVFTAGKKVDDGKTISSLDDFDNWGVGLHSLFAMIIPVLAIALLITAFVIKEPGAPKWAGYVFGDVVLQWVLAFIAFGVPALGVLHAVNAFIMIGLAEMAARKVGVVGLHATAAPASV